MIDGWLVRASLSGLDAVWVVVGYEHPEWGVVVVPYRVAGRRVPPKPSWLAPGSDAWLDCMGRRVPVVDRSRIHWYIDPEAALRSRLRDLPSPARELAELVEAEGLTGSWALGAEGPASDVDLISYTEEAIKALRDAAAEGLVEACQRKPKWGPPAPPAAGGVRLTDACYKGVPYTLRILRHRDPLPCTRRRWAIGKWAGRLRIVATVSLALPATYRVILEGLGEAMMQTWHTRYTMLPPGLYEAELTLYHSEGEGLVVSPDLYGRLEPARGSS